MSIRKRVSNEIRKELDRFVNWPATNNMSLGLVGEWDGKEAEFNPHSTLSSLGISEVIEDLQLDLQGDEYYNTAGCVSASLKVHVNDALSAIEIEFKSKTAIALQCYKTEIKQLNKIELLKQIKNNYKIVKNGHSYGGGDKYWDEKWLIVTSVWIPKGYTIFVSGSDKSQVKVTSNNRNSGLFNIANHDAGINLEYNSDTTYHLFAERHSAPFFDLHRIIIDRGQLRLKKYGKNKIENFF